MDNTRGSTASEERDTGVTSSLDATLDLEVVGESAGERAPRFYFTAHPGDLNRKRLLPGSHVMLVAAAHWLPERRRFRIARPPRDHVRSIAVDSGGFTAARRWGAYPWSAAQYADFVRDVSRGLPLDFATVMDYACEPGVEGKVLPANRARIEATIAGEGACRAVAPDLPWLPVLQGDTLAERELDLELRRQARLMPRGYAGVGSLCGRSVRFARRVIRFYLDHLPGCRYHGFGLHIATLDDDVVFGALKSWDSYSWNWARGRRGFDRQREYLRKPGESWSDYTHRLARLYATETIAPRLSRTRQMLLW